MNYDIYCDESNPDSFWSKAEHKPKYFLLGGLWTLREKKEDHKRHIYQLKETFSFNRELKWSGVSKKHIDFYKRLIDYFCSTEDMHFRCIAVESGRVDFAAFHGDDRELGFYKFYYQLLNKWIYNSHSYRFFFDEKTNRSRNRLSVLEEYLAAKSHKININYIQALPSKEVVLIQLTDILLGAVSSEANKSIGEDSPKRELINYLACSLGLSSIKPTDWQEKKFNIFKIMLKGKRCD